MKLVKYKQREDITYFPEIDLWKDDDGNIIEDINEIESIEEIDDLPIESDEEKLFRLEQELESLKQKFLNK